MRTPFRLLLVSVIAFAASIPYSHAATLDDLKKLEIICFVPSYLPEGFQLNKVDITYDEAAGDDHDPKQAVPLYAIEYAGDKATFSIESAWEGIGDRNIMDDEENAEETEITSPFGPMYLIYRPKGKEGRKDEIIANWVSDANMNGEKANSPLSHATLGRFHGFSATGITLADFGKIVQSLQPVRGDIAAATSPPSQEAPALKIHPKVFSMINCWISDSETPVVTEINLDAVEKNGNQFNDDDLKQDGQWLRSRIPDGNGFMRYRVLQSKGDRYKVEYQENGGGSLTTTSVIEFNVEERNIHRDGKPVMFRALRVTSLDQK
jgi:hypothetical protein